MNPTVSMQLIGFGFDCFVVIFSAPAKYFLSLHTVTKRLFTVDNIKLSIRKKEKKEARRRKSGKTAKTAD